MNLCLNLCCNLLRGLGTWLLLRFTGKALLLLCGQSDVALHVDSCICKAAALCQTCHLAANPDSLQLPTLLRCRSMVMSPCMKMTCQHHMRVRCGLLGSSAGQSPRPEPCGIRVTLMQPGCRLCQAHCADICCPYLLNCWQQHLSSTCKNRATVRTIDHG